MIQLHRLAGFLERQLSERGMVVQVTGSRVVFRTATQFSKSLGI